MPNVYTVNTTADSGEGSLRWGIEHAVDSDKLFDKIVFDSTVFPAGVQTTIALNSQLAMTARDLEIDGGETWTAEYVWRTVNNVLTRVFIDENNPAQEGEVVREQLRTRVILDAQNVSGRRCLYGASGNYKISVSGVTFTNGKLTGSNYGAAVQTRNSAAKRNVFSYCAFVGGDSVYAGGIVAYGTAQNIIEHCFFDQCMATNGGAIYSVNTGQNYISDCFFDRCYGRTGATSYGGAVYSANTSKNELSNCVFDSCTATNGAAIYATATSYNNVVNCVFNKCAAITSGGVIMSGTSAQGTFSNCTFNQCTAANGGVLYTNNSSQHEFSDCVFNQCSGKTGATTYGGAIYSATSAKSTFTNCTFESISANYGGTVYSTNDSRNVFDNCVFNSCLATNNGGVLFSVMRSQNVISECSFSQCTANNGGALYLANSSQNSLYCCTFDSCVGRTGTTYGGAIYVNSLETIISECTFESCSASYAGGVYIRGISKVDWQKKNRFVDCTSTLEGSAIRNAGFYITDSPSNLIFENCDLVNILVPEQQTIRYFTTTADSGEGSLRAAITAANAYDIIEPDPTVFAEGTTIEIELASVIAFNKHLFFKGAGRRVRLNGQGVRRIANVTAILFFEDFDFVKSYDVTASIFYVTSGYTIKLIRCLLAGNYGAKLAYGNSAVPCTTIAAYSSLFIGNGVTTDGISTNAYFYFFGSTIAGNCYANGLTYCSPLNYIYDSISIDQYATADFIVAPPLCIGTWNNSLFESFDLRLKYSSPYINSGSVDLSSNEDTALDFYGRQRKLRGAIGAIEGSWLVIPENGMETIDEDITVDFLEVSDGATITFEGVDRKLTVSNDSVIGESVVMTADSADNGFVIVPSGTSISATCTRVDVVQYTADVNSFKLTSKVAMWGAKHPEIPVVIQKQVDDIWETIANVSGGSYRAELTDETVRLFDGKNFWTPTRTQFDMLFWSATPHSRGYTDGHVWTIDSATVGPDAEYNGE